VTARPDPKPSSRLGPPATRWRFLATIAATGVLGGCASGTQFAQDVAEARTQWLWPMAALAALATGALALAIQRDARRRGTYLGVLFGALGEVSLARRLSPDYSTLFQESFVNWLLPVGTAGITARFLAQIAFVTIVAAALLILSRVVSRRPRLQGEPYTGLAAYFVTLGLLLLFELTIARFVYSSLMSFLIA
jgi:hypothetical protein